MVRGYGQSEEYKSNREFKKWLTAYFDSLTIEQRLAIIASLPDELKEIKNDKIKN